jgi:hypothetical protein
MLGKIPMLVEQPPYLVWLVDLKLNRYLQSFGGDHASLQNQDQIVQSLLTRRLQLPASHADYTVADRQLSGCLTSLIAQVVFSQQGLGQIKSQILKPLQLQQHFQPLEAIDVYAIGLEIISQPVQFLQNFKSPASHWYSSLSIYSHQKFPRLLIDRLRSLPNMSGFKRTNLGLLVRSSPKRVKIALMDAGEREPRLAGLLVIHQYLQEGVSANQFSTKNPEAMHYEELFARCREQCEGVSLPVANRDIIIELLNYMGTVLRKYLQPPQVSFDQPVGEGLSTRGDFIPDARISAATEIDITDDQQQVQRLKKEVVAILEQLSLDRAALLLWLYGLKLTQAEAGRELNLDQATIKRRRDRYLAQLAKNLHQSVGLTTDLSIDTLAEIVHALMAICENYYPESLMAVLTNIQADMCELAITDAVTEQLCQQFVAKIQERWQFVFKPAQMGESKAAVFVRDALKSSC